MTIRLFKLVVVLIAALVLFAGMRLTLGAVSAAQSIDWESASLAPLYTQQQNGLPNAFPVITHTASQEWVGISGDCVVFRDNRAARGGVYLYNLSTNKTFAITEEPDEVRKVVVSQGVVVWRSERQGKTGLWGYYNPSCSDAGIFGAKIIGPFHIVSRANAHAPALSGEMLTFDTWAPKGWWYVALIELDANNNGIPDAAEPGYDPASQKIFVPISYPFWEGQHGQRMSDIYWGDDYKVACWYSDSGGKDGIECIDLNHRQEPNPWTYRFLVSSNAKTVADYEGVIAVHQDLVVWTDYRDLNLSGYDLYIADLDPDNDGTLNPDKPAEFVLVNRPWHQEYPDIWWPFVVWTDRRNGNQEDIYAYDLSLDSDGDGSPNWRDPNRACIDPAEFPVVLYPGAQTSPEIWNGTVIWEDWRNGNGDIYGAPLQPVSPQPRVPVAGTAQEKAIYWLDKQTAHFPQAQNIPGYVAATRMITRYKSFMRQGDDKEYVIQAWYSPTVGSYLVSFDFCYYGTPDQKRFLGRFGRGFTYDQALTLIAHTMLSQQAKAEELGRYVSNFQNGGQLSTTIPGSFGFSFNGQGFWGEKDNFYDMNYLRGGANGWLGYGYLFYSRRYGDMQFVEVMNRIGDYILGQQILDPSDSRYGLFKGGYGRWFENLFFDQDITWVSTEHNIDIYFFLRDLGQLTGDGRYSDAATLQKKNMDKLWDNEKGRLNQGVNDPADALDAASWGAMYWIAVGDLDKAMRSLQYADDAYRNTVTVSNTVTANPKITLWGYKPYTGTVDEFDWSGVDLVWSEGSLGVAMANLKLGHALLDRCDPQGHVYIQKAKDIVTEMEKLQALDPEGGLFYAVYPDYPAFPGGVITDFARAPSAAGTNWLLMVQRAIEDKVLRDAFWGPDPIPTEPPIEGGHSVFLPVIFKHNCS
jgi:beta propeller repeat protein